MDFDFIKIIVAIILACAGWFIVNSLSAKRDLAAKKRELVTKYQMFNSLVQRIKLKNSPPFWIKWLKFHPKNHQNHIKGEEIAELLQELRNDLRKELQLTEVSSQVITLRYFKEGK